MQPLARRLAYLVICHQKYYWQVKSVEYSAISTLLMIRSVICFISKLCTKYWKSEAVKSEESTAGLFHNDFGIFLIKISLWKHMPRMPSRTLGR